MMRTIRLDAPLVIMLISSGVSAGSIYGSSFNYKNAKPVATYFPGKTPDQIKAFCKGDSLASMDATACAQFEYEALNNKFKTRLSEVRHMMSEADKHQHAKGDSYALPYFERSQVGWETYRDNECYAEVYEVGPATSRFSDFWDCMTRITKARLDEISPAKNGE